MKPYVFDASALLATIYFEKGADVVDSHLGGVIISTVNLTEIIESMISKGMGMDKVYKIIDKLSMKIMDYTQQHAFVAAQLRQSTRTLGLSLGDRACLALAKVENLPILTADRSWANLDAGVKIKVIR